MTTESRPALQMPEAVNGYCGEKLSFDDLGKVLAESRYGRILKGKPRFDYYRPNTTPVEKWIELLGPDVDNLLHMPYTFSLAREFLENNKDFDSNEKIALLFCAMTHDMQEAITGDRRKPDKTDSEEKMEAELLASILGEVLASEIDAVKLAELTTTVKEIMIDEHSKLGRAFSAIEKLGYAKTALRAWEIKKQGGLIHYGENPLQTGLGMLAHSVFTHQAFKMVDYAEDFSFMRSFLAENVGEITEILEESEEFETYENAKIMNLSVKSWDRFRASLPA